MWASAQFWWVAQLSKAREVVGAVGAGDLEGAVGAVGVEDVDVVGPGDGVETAGEILLLIAG
jgi:hypothetical protein